MKVGDLVRHTRKDVSSHKHYGIIVQIETNTRYRQATRWKVAWGKWGHVGWIYNPKLLEVVNESNTRSKQ